MCPSFPVHSHMWRIRWVDADDGGTISAVELTKAVAYVVSRRVTLCHVVSNAGPVTHRWLLATHSRGPKCTLRDKPFKVLRLFHLLDEDGSGELGTADSCPCTPTLG